MENKNSNVYKSGELPLPEKIIIETTLRCNLSCNFCFRDLADYRELSFREVEKMVDNFGPSIKKVGLTGGEVFLRKDIFDILDLLSKKKYSIGVLSNGTLLSEEMIEKLVKYENLNIGMSLDGLEKTHNYVRGKNSFQKTLASIKSIRGRIPIGIVTVISKENIDEIIALFRKIAPYISYYTVQFEMFNNKKEIRESAKFFETQEQKISTWINDRNAYSCSKEKVSEIIKTLRSLSDKYKIPFCTEPFLAEDYLDDFFDGEILKGRPFCSHIKTARCDVQGNFIFCHLVKKTFGSLMETPLPVIWNSESLKNLRKKFLKESRPPLCRRCCRLVVDPPVIDTFATQF